MSRTPLLSTHANAFLGLNLILIIGASLLGYGMPAKAEDLGETIRTLKSEVARLNARIEELERRYTRDRQARPGRPGSARKETPTAAVTSAEPRAARAKPSTATIPGIDTRVQIGGRVKLDVIYNSTSVGRPGGTNLGDITLLPSATPVGGSGEDDQITLSARESRFWLTSHTPTDYGELSTNLEFDLLAAQSSGAERVGNSHTPRLRHAYGVLGKLLLGQAWTTFMNVGSFPELNDSGGPAGIIDVRQPQIRWTEPFSWGEWQIALEEPETTLTDPAGNRVTPDDDRLPDLVSKLLFEDGWGQFSLAGMLRQIRSDGAVVAGRSDAVLGVALSLGGRLRTFEQGNLRFNFNYGNALGRYVGLNVFNEGSIDGQGDIELSEVVGGFIAYQHWWDPRLRSTLSYSRLHADNDLSRVPRTVTEWVESRPPRPASRKCTLSQR